MKKLDILNIYWKIEPKKRRKANKKQFCKHCSKFSIDEITYILQRKIEFTDKNGNKIKNIFLYSLY